MIVREPRSPNERLPKRPRALRTSVRELYRVQWRHKLTTLFDFKRLRLRRGRPDCSRTSTLKIKNAVFKQCYYTSIVRRRRRSHANLRIGRRPRRPFFGRSIRARRVSRRFSTCKNECVAAPPPNVRVGFRRERVAIHRRPPSWFSRLPCLRI